MNPFQINIKGDVWNIYMIPDHDTTISDEDAAAHTDFDLKESYFRKGDLSLGIVKHEVWHMYWGYTCLSDTTSMTLSDIEEVSATMYEYNDDKMRATTIEIYNTLIELRNNEA